MKLTVLMSDGNSLDVTAKPGDMVRFERQFGIAFEDLSTEKKDADGNIVIDPETYEPVIVPSAAFRLEHTFFLAWASLHRTSQFAGTFEDFLDNVEDLDIEGDAAPLDPPAAS